MRTLPLLAILAILALNACAPAPTVAPATQPATAVETQAPTVAATVPPSETKAPIVSVATDMPIPPNSYSNDAFGLAFQFPAGWYGPEEYVSGQTLRVEVGSDKVYPYGEPPAQPSDVKNSYDVVVQYDKGTQAPPDVYATLQALQDGASSTGPRSLVTRVRQVDLGRFTGFEFISTLPEGAQTDHVYIREVLLVDKQTGDLLTVMGQPLNVDVAAGGDWRAAYQGVDQANQDAFEGIVASLTAK